MTITRHASGRVLATVAALAMLAAGSARAAEPRATVASAVQAPIVSVGADEQAVARRLDIAIGRSVVIELPRDAKEVFVANPKVANAVVRSTRKLFLIGIENGSTSIFVMDAEGRQIAAIEATVGRDLNVLRETLRTVLPAAHITLKPAGDSIVLTGTVASASEAQQAVDLATAFVGQTGVAAPAPTAGGPATSSIVVGKVINSLTIRGRDQVMLRVTVVEVSRAVLKQFGITTQASWSPLSGTGGASFVNAPQFGVNGQQGPNALTVGGSTPSGFSASATLRAFERAGVSRILAEPTLTAISGEQAKFTVGGEIPIVIQCGTQVGCTPTIEYKPYGVLLNFTPVVLSEGRISLRVGTEVSELDTTVSVGGYPGLRVRRSETTVELPSGGAMVTAGLIQQSSRQAIEGLPGLLNVPVLGALFRSRDYQRQETELMILVTPYIAAPIEPAQVKRPDDGFVDSSDGQAILLGRLNRLYGVAGAPPPQAARFKGRFGFITD
jgi:pilus assembly protein CpaC